MTDTNQSSGFFTELKRELKQIWRATAAGYSGMGVSVRNHLRHWRKVQLDYIVMPIGGSLPQRAAPPRSFIERQLPLPAAPLSMEELNGRLRAVADAENVKGVVFVFQGFSTGIATIQDFRQSVSRLQAAGKAVMVYTPYMDLRHYYAAAAADKIFVPPSANFDFLGLRAEATFFKDALKQIGVEVDVVQISPFKTAYDGAQHNTMTPEHRAQIDWLLDDQFDILTADLAQDRHMSQEQFKTCIDNAPHTAESALAVGLVDAIAYEDELALLLADVGAHVDQAKSDAVDSENMSAELIPPVKSVEPKTVGDDEQMIQGAEVEALEQPKAKLKSWDQAYALLLEKRRRQTRKYIGVIALEGLIIMGQSQRPPIDLPIPFIGGAAAGEQTLVRLLRQAETMDDMAALIFYVNSGGGLALASDLIGREIERLNKKKPVLAYMGDMAASGGYYVAAPAEHIMCQPLTTTGSIGVIMARPSTRDLYAKLNVNRTQIKRGQHADLYSDHAPMSETERQIFWDSVMDSYHKFKRVVANGRSLPFEELDTICEGRVWTGRQALAHKLVDSHGDFSAAINKAAQMADLSLDANEEIRVVNIYAHRDGHVMPETFEAAKDIGRILSREWVKELNSRPLWLLPSDLNLY
ncbi:MAG: signal peptide peptidase SppA [Anaerolineales bacterium]|nr:signal peptide peptidase SppA [Anaerolineales bacterium]